MQDSIEDIYGRLTASEICGSQYTLHKSAILAVCPGTKRGSKALPLLPHQIPRELAHLYDNRIGDAPSAKRGRVRLSREAIREVALAFQAHGAAAVQTLAIENPLDFLRLVVSLIPKPDSDLESQNETPLNQLSDNDLDNLREALRLQVERIQPSQGDLEDE
jgi:hypothetical protein